jgi:PAS domain S-box-containing protein
MNKTDPEIRIKELELELGNLKSGLVFNDENGKMQSVLSEIPDNTKRNKIEDELKNSEEYFSSIFENSASAICIIEPDTTISKVNNEYCKLSGYTKEEVIGKSWTQQIQSEDFERFKKHILMRQIEPKNSNEKFELIFNRKNGEVRHLLMSLTLLSNNKSMASFLDITEATKAQSILAESSQFNSQIINNVDDGIIVFDKDLCYKVWNPFMEKITGIPASFVIGKKVSEVSSVLNEIRITENFKVALEGHGSDSFNFQFHFPDSGKSGWASCKTNPMKDVFGEITGIILTIYEITELKQTESDLIMAKEKAEESDRLKTAFLTNMSHEIRTPMNGILGFAELLKEPTLTFEEQQEFIKTIGISGERMLSTINSIVDISKIEAGMVNVDINETNISEKMLFTYKFFKPEVESKGLKFLFKYSLPANEAIIKTDNEKIYSILTNLVKNAIKFTHKGSIEFGYEKKGEYLEFYVKDTGIGIPKNQKGLIFDRFRQGSESHNRGYEGSGLGLSICKSYVEMLGGIIWVESEEGLGSTFYFTIPYNPVSEKITKVRDVVSEEHKDVQLKKLKILVVEDDEISYSLLKRTIQKISNEVLHAITGVEAVEACRDNPDFDLVLMDIRMPRMNGLEATQRIRQFNKDVIIIAQTAYGFSSDCEKALKAGCNDYIAKPINIALLYELIRKHINIEN